MNYEIVKQQFENNDIFGCEYDKHHDCNRSWLTVAHRHKRRYYKGKEKMLESFNQTALLCITAHEKIEHSREETKRLFQELRGDDIMDV